MIIIIITTEATQKFKPKETRPVWVTQTLKSTCKEIINKLLLSPLIKHQTISSLYVEDTTFRSN